MKAILQIWKQEYSHIFSDTGILLVFFAVQLVYPFIYPLPYQKEVLKDVPVAVVDLDHSRISRKLTRMLDANEYLQVKQKPLNLNEAQTALLNGAVNGIFVIPGNFNRSVLRGEQAHVSIYADASYFLIYRQVVTGAYQTCATLSAGIEIKRMRARGRILKQVQAARDPLPLLSITLFNPSGGYASYVVPAVLILILQQSLLVGIGMIGGTARETGRIKVDKSSTVGASAVAMVLGKTGAYFSIYAIHAIYFFSILFRVYRFPQRAALLDLLIFILPFLLAVIFLGLSLVNLFHERETAMLCLVFTSIPFLFLAGFSWPVESIPTWIRAISYLLPSTTGIDGFLKMNHMGAGLREVGSQWLIQWGLAGGYFVIASVLMNQRIKSSVEVNDPLT